MVESLVLGGWFLSAIALLVGIAILVSHVATGNAERAWRFMCVATFIAVFAMQISEQLTLSPNEGPPVMTALFNTIQTFILQRDAPSMTDEIKELLGSLAKPYVAYGVLVSLLAPAATVGSAIIAFSRIISLPLLWLRSGRHETFVFSELNESSLALASSIQERYVHLIPHQRCTIAFARCTACGDENLTDEARAQSMLLSKMSIGRLMRWCRGREHCHMVLSERSGLANITEGLHLTETNPQTTRHLPASMHVLSSANDAETYADVMARRTLQKGGCKVRWFDPTVAAVRQVLIEAPLFLTGVPNEISPEELYGQIDRRIMVIGASDLASEFLRMAIWCGRAYGLHVTIDVVDKDAARLREQLAFTSPEIMSNLDEDGYDLRFHDCSCSSEEFLELTREVGCEVTYVLVSQADDLLTADVARRVRGLLESCRMRAGATGASPLVLAAVKDSSIATAITQAQAPDGQAYDVQIAHCGGDQLTYENLFMPHVERWAKKFNRAIWGCYDGEQENRRTLEERADAAFEASELNRCSSAASVLFCKHVLFSFCRRVWARELSVDIDPAQLPEASAWTQHTEDNVFDAAWEAYDRYVSSATPTWLEELEHERWVAYMRVLGYEFADGTARDSLMEAGAIQNQIARLHVCLVDHDELQALDDAMGKIPDEQQALSFTEARSTVIRYLPEIIHGTE